MIGNRQYIVITPARNEQETIGHTIRSMAAQTQLPLRWVIINDGSNDETARLIDQAAGEHSWISAVHRGDRGFRHSGGGVIEAFYAGYEAVQNEPWDFLVKFDADLSFDTNYFQHCFEKFGRDPRLGIGGGMICRGLGPPPIREYSGDPPFHVRGATKIYRRECWNQIGGLHRAPGWDTIDEVKANMLGWFTCTFEDVPLLHHRPAGSADGAWKNWMKNGYANYVTGYHPLFMFIKCLSRLLKQPYFLAGFGLFCGYASGYFRPDQRVADKEMVRFLRREQWKRLFLRPSIWS